MSLKKTILEKIDVGKRYQEEVMLINFEKKVIPMTKETYYVYEFESMDGEEIYKCVLNKRRNSLKGLISGDYLKISFDVKEKLSKNKYMVNKVRVLSV